MNCDQIKKIQKVTGCHYVLSWYYVYSCFIRCFSLILYFQCCIKSTLLAHPILHFWQLLKINVSGNFLILLKKKKPFTNLPFVAVSSLRKHECLALCHSVPLQLEIVALACPEKYCPVRSGSCRTEGREWNLNINAPKF